MPRFQSIAVALIVSAAIPHAGAAKPSAPALDALRLSYVELQRDVMLANPSTLVPGNSRVAVYVTLDPRATASLAGVSLEINGAAAGAAQYSDRERDVLRRGASDVIHIGSVAASANTTLAATVSGANADGSPFVKIATLDLPESSGPRFVDIELSHTQTKDLPDVVARIVSADEAAAADPASCDWVLGCALAATTGAAADLQYRSVLYFAYQDRNEQAMLRAMALVALTPQDAAARIRLQLAELSAASAAGNDAVADSIIAALEPAQLDPPARARFAFLRARESDRRQDWPGLQNALIQLDQARTQLHEAQPVPAAIDAEIAFMRAESAIADGDFDRAQAIIATGLSAQDSLRAYALFNLGVKLRVAGLPTRAERVFSQLASMPVYTQDALDIKERARVALSVVNLQRTESASAEAVLRDAPAQGRYHDQFMVSYATRAMEHGDYELAARIWLTLANEAPWSTAGKTAQVAYPMCLEHIAAPTIVLAQYRDAQAKFEQRLTDLDALTRRIDDPAWIAALLVSLEEHPSAALPQDPTVAQWRSQLGHDDWLYWFTADSTQTQFRELRELERISAWLATDVPKAFESRARTLAANAARLADDRRAQLLRAFSEIARNEFAMAQQQLRLIKVGIARTTDRVAEQRPPQVKP